ncbi:MAG: energy-coupling factor ABC transporter ATP-binding protein [Thaumarchaeota archaeon]|nr:energy-coupling factor ABC transporter ATP-binding protein [Candidatus Geocrenenecus arthurdayi]
MAIEIKDLTFRYANKEEPALRKVNMRIMEGETVLLAGRSGSGKSTLIKAINGLIPNRYEGFYEGEVNVLGVVVKGASLSYLSRLVGTVMQEVGKQLIMPNVEDDVAFGPCNLCFPREEVRRRVEDSLRGVNAIHLRGRDVNELSGGEKQRIAIAGILALDPPIVLMDEPLANLDSEGVWLVQEQIKMMKKRGKTIIIAEHRTEEILEIGVDRILFMEDGRILREIKGEDELKSLFGIIKVPLTVMVKECREFHAESKKRELGSVSVKIENVSFDYDGKQALKDVNLEIREGERVALLGNNGAGKSTLAKLILGILKPKEGRVLVYGMDTKEKEVYELANYVGLVFQDPSSMIFARSVEEELSYGPRNLGVHIAEITKRVEETSLKCGIHHLLKYSPFATSHGEKKRISVGSILTMRPKILILDEPSAGQDYASCRQFMDFIMGLFGDVKTLILITHDTDLAIEYTDRTVILSGGRVIADGPTRYVLANENYLSSGRIRETSLIKTGKRITSGKMVLSLKEILEIHS